MMVFGASVIVASGFLDIVFASNVSGSVPSGTYLQIWGGAIGIVSLGFVLIVAAVLVGLSRWPSAGVILGVLASILVALLTIGFVEAGISATVTWSQAQLSGFMYFGSILALFVGFPFGMAGSFGGLKGPAAAEVVS